MKGIAQELQKRMDALQKEREKLLGRLKEIEEIQVNLKQVIRAEKAVFSRRKLKKNGKIRVSGLKQAASSSSKRHSGSTPLIATLAGLLADKKPHMLADLIQGAVDQGHSFGKKAPGRVVHFALLNMRNSERVDRGSDGSWRLTEK